MSRYDFGIIGGGIVGLATAMALQERHPGASVLLLEKEDALATHQTGHNSGVVHSGVYYVPGSLKARLALAGNREMVRFCREEGIDHRVCGKVIVATEEEELPRLEALRRRGLANGLAVEKIGPGRLRELEPHVEGLAAIHVPSAGIVDFGEVAGAFGRRIRERGADVRLGVEVRRVSAEAGGVGLETDAEAFRVGFAINCAGLHSDRIARRAGLRPDAKIVPFRGEYYELVPDRRSLVGGLIYPVPDPRFPFLGVHFTRAIDGSVHAGPNAVLALAREGYRWTDVDLADAAEALGFPGLWRLAARNWRAGAKEVARSLSRRLFCRSLQRLVPEVREEDLVPAPAGVRAQALRRDGGMVDDFLILRAARSIHVCNAPSPAATASIPIGRAIVERIPEELRPAGGGRQAVTVTSPRRAASG